MKATPGDIVQARTRKNGSTGNHTMIFLKADNDGMYVLQADGTKKLITEKGEYDIPDDAKDRLNSGTSNFLFIGKGWGPGVGVSQWGIMNLAKAGCPWEDIIHAYFTNVVIAHWNTLGLQ